MRRWRHVSPLTTTWSQMAATRRFTGENEKVIGTEGRDRTGDPQIHNLVL
jgi:hypothetical protein